MRHSVYILNMLPTRAIAGMTPYEAWNGKKPHLQHIKVFSCIAHMKVPAVQVKKLDDRNRTDVYMGSQPGTKAHHLYDSKEREILISIDVVFEESKSRMWELSSQGDLQ